MRSVRSDPKKYLSKYVTAIQSSIVNIFKEMFLKKRTVLAMYTTPPQNA